jgi:hypothetical protein
MINGKTVNRMSPAALKQIILIEEFATFGKLAESTKSVKRRR